MSSERIEALRQAIQLSPNNYALRHILAETLQLAGYLGEALQEYDTLLQAGVLEPKQLLPVAELALQLSNLDIASRCLDTAVRVGVVEGVAKLRADLDAKLAEQGYLRVVMPTSESNAKATPLEQEEKITFKDVGGLDEVKKIIHKMIILPLLRPDVYRKYGRKSGGGVLLYGPPGCGKTLLARATAGECNLPFFNIRIEEVLDPFIGVSERNLHLAFEQARLQSPCVLFIDELDALAFTRRKHLHNSGRALVDQFLQELDAIGADNTELLILAATNAPWDVDDALLRPGRFDRRVFVPPPDPPAREAILSILLANIPAERINLTQISQDTPLFSGADLKALVDQAIDLVIDLALETGSEPPLTNKHLAQSRTGLRPTTLDWLERAQNYVEFANQDKRYDEVATYLKTVEVRKWRK